MYHKWFELLSNRSDIDIGEQIVCRENDNRKKYKIWRERERERVTTITIMIIIIILSVTHEKGHVFVCVCVCVSEIKLLWNELIQSAHFLRGINYSKHAEKNSGKKLKKIPRILQQKSVL